MNYFGHRQNPLRDVSIELLNETFKHLHQFFGTEWLTGKGDHPLQVLWRRKDFIATNELYLLADALKNLSKLDYPWVAHQVNLAKIPNINNQRGAFFELIGLNYLLNSSGESRLEPTKANEAGFDATLHFSAGSRINYSLKNYGTSTFQATFEGKSRTLENIIKHHAVRLRLKTVHVFIG
jgi:hypothetical protein